MKVEVRSQDGAREFAWRARVMFSEEKTHRVRRDGARELHGSCARSAVHPGV
jgi:hypothetical protein